MAIDAIDLEVKDMNRNLSLKSLFRAAAAAAVLTLAVPLPVTHAAGQSSAKVDIILNGQTFDMESPPFVEDGVTYLPVRELGQLLGSVVSWHGSIKTVAMTYPDLTVRLTQGSSEATVNGQSVRLSTSLKTVDGRIYAPLRFFSQATGAAVMWDGRTNAVRIGKPEIYTRGGGVNVTTWLNRQTGDLYVAFPYEQAPVRVGKVADADFQGSVSVGTVPLGSRAMYVQLLDHYGEPMVQYDDYGVLVRNGKIVDQKKAHYFQRYEPNSYHYQVYDPNGWLQYYMLTDGRKLTVYNDRGEVAATHDLPALAGKDESYAVLGAGQTFLVVRPNATGMLTLIDLTDRSVVELAGELLTGEDLDYARTNDVPFRGDSLTFGGANTDESELYFYYRSPLNPKGAYIRLPYDRKAAN